MLLKDLKHNKQISSVLLRSLECGHIVNAYLFYGQKAASEELALAFAKDLLGTEKEYPEDLMVITREDRAHILVDDIEHLQEELKFKAFGDRRAVIINEADLIVETAQNKLLKTLEEPFSGTTIILTAQRRDALLPTVRSRCIEYSVEALPETYSEEISDIAKLFFETMSQEESFYKLKNILKPVLDDKTSSREKSLEFLNVLEDIIRDCILYKNSAESIAAGVFSGFAKDSAVFFSNERLDKAVHLIEDTRRRIKYGQNTSYAMKGMCLNI